MSPIHFSTERHCADPASPYDGFNITPYTGDAPAHVRLCRQQLCQRLGIDDRHLILPRQVHGTAIAEVTASNLDAPFDGIDALVTTLPNTCIGVSTADCVPLLFHDPASGAIAAVHAGWRGTVARIASHTLLYMTAHFGTNPADLRVHIGPSIGPDAFEVGDEVYAAFSAAHFPMSDIAFQRPPLHPAPPPPCAPTASPAAATAPPPPCAPAASPAASTTPPPPASVPASPFPLRWHIDLWRANASDLIAAGVPTSSIHIAGLCTYSNPARFFSARRLGIHSGRIFTGILSAVGA
ncbi:MAG: peptidoglycan editing factor PgeF [Bacteroidales bacterium]|nr:peptidoglycan editing factor PgeF [Bacteroidales bacterium]